MKIKEAVGLIGVGNMGTAIVEGLLKKERVHPAQVTVYDKLTGKAQEFSKQWGTHTAKSNEELARLSSIIVLAVKPQDLLETAAEMKPALGPKHILISILAGVPLAKFREVFGPGPELVRAMPNLGAKVGESMTAITADSDRAFSFAEQIFLGCGKIARLEEKHFDLVTAVSGSGPAYFFLLMELMAQAAQEQGLTAEQARLFAVQTALGAGLLAAASDAAPDELRRRVTSKGGTTEAALKIFEQKKLGETVKEAVLAAVNRGKELAQGK